MLPIAHAGHWILWFLYAVPLIVVVASIVVSILRNRDRPAEPDEQGEEKRGGPSDGSGPHAQN